VYDAKQKLRIYIYIYGILELILKSNTKSDCTGPEPVRPVWQTGQTDFASQSNQHSSSRLHRLSMQAYLHQSLIADNHPDSRSFIGLNFKNPEPPKNFSEVGFLQQFSEPPVNFPEPLRSVLLEKQGCVWPLEFALKIGIFLHLFICFNLV
jgi:hypothetical protein